MKLSVKVDYACRVLAAMARVHGTGQFMQIEALSRVEAVPVNFLAQILGELRETGLIVSKRGAQGGYTLSRAPSEITLLDIMRAIDGEILGSSGNYAGRSGSRMKEIWADLRSALEDKAREITLDDLVTIPADEMYHI